MITFATRTLYIDHCHHTVVGGQRQGEHREGDAGGAVQDCQEGDEHQHGRDHFANHTIQNLILPDLDI